jgi:hypothetical protein
MELYVKTFSSGDCDFDLVYDLCVALHGHIKVGAFLQFFSLCPPYHYYVQSPNMCLFSNKDNCRHIFATLHLNIVL